MPDNASRSIPLSLPRRLIGDLMHFAHRVPTVPVQRRMRLAALRDAREACLPRIGWSAVFVKAYALVCQACPALRRAYMTFPTHHLFEHAYSVASVAVERDYQGEPAVFFGKIRSPESRTLVELDRLIRELKDMPVEKVPAFRRALWTSKWPLPIRRMLWWAALNLFGDKRAHYMGTFGLSVYASLGASSLHPLSPITSTLNYGPIEADGCLDVRLIYDHRVLDGATVARALADLEDMLTGPMVQELTQQAASRAA